MIYNFETASNAILNLYFDPNAQEGSWTPAVIIPFISFRSGLWDFS